MVKKFVLIDAHSIIYRSYFAFIRNPLKNSKGETTSGIFGFLNTLEKIKQNISSDYIGLVFDAPGKTFRDDIYEEYKATRPPTPPDLPYQVAKVKEICQHLGMPLFELEGYEADDILATFAIALQKKGSVYIVTSDKDLFQLVTDRIFIYDAYKNQIYDRAMVVKKFKISPERIAEYLALTGDTSDNIPGVPGIGPKRAVEILKRYSNFEQALVQEKKIQQHREQALLSHKLVMLECHVPLNINPQALRVKEPEIDELMPILLELELHSYIKTLGQTTQTQLTSKHDSDLSTTKPGDVIGIYQEAADQVIICFNEHTLFKVTTDAAAHLLRNTKILKIGYDLKNLLKNMVIEHPFFDVKIAGWLIDPNRHSYKLEDLALHYLNEYATMTPLQAAQCIYRLYPVLKKKLNSHYELYKKIEEPLVNVLTSMEKRGIRIDLDYFARLSKEFGVELTQIEKKIYDLANMSFNINSPKQLAQILFEKLKLKPRKKGKSHYSTSVEVLQQLSYVHPLPSEVLKYRGYAKIKSTFIDPLIAAARKSRIHTTFNQTGTSTGRLSSTNPNIQNIPIRTEVGRRIRKGFIAESGFSLISADYSQVELRLLAHMSKDKNLKEAFYNNKDIHRHTAALIYGIAEKDVGDNKRRMAKVVNYGLIYGMSDFGLVQRLDIPREAAIQFIDSYYNLYPEVEKWRENAICRAEDYGYTETLLGRRRPLPDIHSHNHSLREFSKRAAINTPIQGTAADLIKIAMIEVEKNLQNRDFKHGLLLSIHDELVVEIENERLEEAKAIIKECMEQALTLDVPIVAAIGVGGNWDEVH
ncbi:MAG: DNA polymerase I [bacterium]